MVHTISDHRCKKKGVNNKNKGVLTIRNELKMVTTRPHYVIHNDLRGYTFPVKKCSNFDVCSETGVVLLFQVFTNIKHMDSTYEKRG